MFTAVTFNKIRRLELFFLINFVVNQKIRLFRYLYGIYCFVCLSKRSFSRLLIASLVLVCSGCPKHIDQTNVESMLRNFENGTIELGSGSFVYEYYQPKMKVFYLAKDWDSLAKTVIEGNFHTDKDYFYLGRSAEGLGFYVAAKRYYAKAISAFKCNKLFLSDDPCDGFSFPRDIDVRMDALQ